MLLPRSVILASAFCLAAIGVTPIAFAQADQPHVKVTLISETRSVTPGQPLQLALREEIEDGWHTYWINPGDSGLPTTIDWTLPTGFTAGDFAFPVPERIVYGPLVSYGYEHEVLLPVTVSVPAKLDAGANVTLSGHAEWLVCSDVCVPEEADVSITLPVVTGPATADPRWTDAFAKTRAAMPIDDPFPTTVKSDAKSIQLHVATGDAGKLGKIAFFPLDDGAIDNDAPQQTVADKTGITVTLVKGPKALSRLKGTLAFEDGSTGGAATRSAISISAPITAGAISATPTARLSGLGLLEALLLAVAGGIVLNLMPCVLPVLSIKALGLVKHAKHAPREVRLQGLAYALGVLVSFGLVAGALIVLRAAGAEIGWGFQLQSPVFVTVMIYILFAVGLSLSGVFTFGDRVAGLGGGLAAREGYSGSFFTGALATLVATPCTAPFMAAAIGYAITQPWYLSLAVFESIGVGLALPYLLLTFSPAMRRFLPKPGAWMDRFKQVLAFPVYGTAVWLAFVLSSESGGIGITAALAGLVLIAFAAWLYEAVRMGEGLGRRLGLGASALAVIGALALLKITDATAPAAASTETTADGGLDWQPFSQAKLDALRADGKPVFIDFTADWCITCKVNERVALRDPRVKDALAAGGVVTLRGDWTRRDGEITRILESHDRGGVPLYLFYRKGNSDKPKVLPQILTADTVLHELQGGL